MLVNTKEDDSLLSDLEVVFSCLRWHNMRLNPQKCAFAIKAGKFLGFMLAHQGIESNPNKCQAILEIKSPTFIKEVQCLTRRIASLSRFIAALARKGLPFFSLLKKESTFKWTLECKDEFTKFKRYLTCLTILSKPKNWQISIFISLCK